MVIENTRNGNEQWKLYFSISSSASAAFDIPTEASGSTENVLREIVSQEALQALFNMFETKHSSVAKLEVFSIFRLRFLTVLKKKNSSKFLHSFRKTSIPRNTNNIGLNIIYKAKHSNDGTLQLKARIAPHGNEEKLKHTLSKDYAVFLPTGVHILESVASRFK